MVHDIEQVSPQEAMQKKTILLVEDDADIGEVLVEVITQETSYQAVLVADSFAALHTAQSIKPQLLVLDYHLPHLNGLELYDRIHALKTLEQTPAIMMSARLPQQELHKRAILGMNKPIDLDEFLQVIEELLA